MSGIVLVLGCGGRVQESDPPIAVDATSADADVSVPITDTGTPPTPTDVGPPPGSLEECFGEMGTSNPATLKDLLYDWSSCPSGDPSCQNSFRFNVGCAIEMRRGIGALLLTATANEADCRVLRRWSTSERLLGALNPSSPEAKACWSMTEPGALGESTIVGGTPYSMKTMFCNVEPFITHRTCLRRTMGKYFDPR